MRFRTEWTSASSRPHACAWLAALLAASLATMPASAQPPSCAWGDGVTLPVSGELGLLLASDGGAGVLALSWPWGSSPGFPGVVSMFHVMEQGRLDPSQPASGVQVLKGADLGAQFQLYPVRAIPDGAGGLFILTRTCNSWAPKLRCWEASEIRLQHVTAQGSPTPGWPANGLVIPCARTPDALEAVDIVPDGAGGTTAVWLDGTIWNGTFPITAQRFAADGTMQWPGGLAGLTVLTSPFGNYSMRVAGDGAGGFVVVASRFVSSTSYRMELVATRVTGAGGLSWGANGKPVLLQPTYSATIRGVSMDAVSGLTFVSASLAPINPGAAQLYTQALTSVGNRAWGILGVPIGPNNPGYGVQNVQILIPSAFATLHTDPSGVSYLQIQDESGSPMLGPDQAGMPLEWMDPWVLPTPLATEDGNLMLILANGHAPDPPDVRAIELDAGANVAPAWPDSGFQVCGGNPGHEFGSAFMGAGHLFVGFMATGWLGTQPAIQRLTRAVLDVVDGRPAHALELAPLSPNPAHGAWTANVGLRESSGVLLEAFDVAGRRALAQDFGTLPPGWHPLQMTGGSLPAGVYRVRVRAGVHSAERVLVRLR